MLVFAMCQIAASGLKLFQNCIMNQKCIVYNDWNFCTRFKTSNIWWQPQTVIHLSGELIAQWFTLVFVLVQSQSIVGTTSSTLCVSMLGGGGVLLIGSQTAREPVTAVLHSTYISVQKQLFPGIISLHLWPCDTGNVNAIYILDN